MLSAIGGVGNEHVMKCKTRAFPCPIECPVDGVETKKLSFGAKKLSQHNGGLSHLAERFQPNFISSRFARMSWPPAFATSSSGSCQTGSCSLLDKSALKLGQGREDHEHQLATSGRRIDGPILNRSEIHTTITKFGDEGHEVAHRSAEPIQTPHD